MNLEIETLKQFVPFCELQEEYLEEALESVSELTYEKGDMLFKRGKEVTKKYYLLSGLVDLIDQSYESVQVNETDERAKSCLNPDSPTKCSCIAKAGSVQAFSIDEAQLDRVMTWSQSAASVMEDIHDPLAGGVGDSHFHVEEVSEETANDWMSSLLQAPLFSRIPMSQVQTLFVKFENIEVEAGSVILKEGEAGDFFYVLSEGTAKVTNNTGDLDIELHPGDFFGEEALLGNTTRNATITMLTNGVLKRLNHDDFTALLKEPVIKHLEPDELTKLDRSYKVIDVKLPIEYRMGHFDGAVNMPLSRLRSKMLDLSHDDVYLVTNDCGSRADIAAHLLCQAGFDAFILNSQAAES